MRQSPHCAITPRSFSVVASLPEGWEPGLFCSRKGETTSAVAAGRQEGGQGRAGMHGAHACGTERQKTTVSRTSFSITNQPGNSLPAGLRGCCCAHAVPPGCGAKQRLHHVADPLLLPRQRNHSVQRQSAQDCKEESLTSSDRCEQRKRCAQGFSPAPTSTRQQLVVAWVFWVLSGPQEAWVRRPWCWPPDKPLTSCTLWHVTPIKHAAAMQSAG